MKTELALDTFASVTRLVGVVAPWLLEAITGLDGPTLAERIERARAAVKDPIDPSEEDAARRMRLERAIRGASS